MLAGHVDDDPSKLQREQKTVLNNILESNAFKKLDAKFSDKKENQIFRYDLGDLNNLCESLSLSTQILESFPADEARQLIIKNLGRLDWMVSTRRDRFLEKESPSRQPIDVFEKNEWCHCVLSLKKILNDSINISNVDGTPIEIIDIEQSINGIMNDDKFKALDAVFKDQPVMNWEAYKLFKSQYDWLIDFLMNHSSQIIGSIPRRDLGYITMHSTGFDGSKSLPSERNKRMQVKIFDDEDLKAWNRFKSILEKAKNIDSPSRDMALSDDTGGVVTSIGLQDSDHFTTKKGLGIVDNTDGLNEESLIIGTAQAAKSNGSQEGLYYETKAVVEIDDSTTSLNE